MLCSSSALRCFTVFSKLNVDGFCDRSVFRAGENVVRLTLDADKDGRKVLVADSGEGAVYVVVSSNDASLAAAANAFVSDVLRLIRLARVVASSAADFARRMEISAIMIGDLPGESVPRKGESILAEVADRF